jgi:hypothetical protein
MANFARMNKDALRSDVAQMEQGKLGFSQGQMGQMRDQGMDSARQAVAAQQTMAARGSMDPRQQAQMQQYGSAAVAQAGAQSAMQAQQMSQAFAEARRAEILARMNQMHDRRRENIQTGINTGLSAAKMMLPDGSQAVQAGLTSLVPGAK